MRVTSKPTNPWHLNDARIAHLNACGAARMSFSAAARELEVDPKTIKEAAERQNLSGWLREKFPTIGTSKYGGTGGRFKGCTGMRYITPDMNMEPLTVYTHLPHVKAAITPWRVTA